MSDLGEGVSVNGDPPPARAEEVFVAPIGARDYGSPVLNPPQKKMLRRSRGRPAKSRPKSPLVRMAEMRKYGLRGRALSQVGKVDSDGSEPRLIKGKKGFGNRGSELLSAIPEFGEEGVKVNDGAAAELVEDQITESLGQNSDAGDPKLLIVIPAGGASDLALDLIAAQPLQEMEFVGMERTRTLDGTPLVIEVEAAKESHLEDVIQEKGEKVGDVEMHSDGRRLRVDVV